MTKGEILCKLTGLDENDLGSYLNDPPFSEAPIAMDIYAKQEAIEYAHWCFKRMLLVRDMPPPADESFLLYEKFIQSK